MVNMSVSYTSLHINDTLESSENIFNRIGKWKTVGEIEFRNRQIGIIEVGDNSLFATQFPFVKENTATLLSLDGTSS